MKAKNPDFRAEVERVFDRARFVTDAGIRLLDTGPGWVETELLVEEKHQQNHGYVHAGVQATMADHTAGAAATTLLAANEHVLSVEFKINLVSAAKGERLTCRADVIKPGSQFTFVKSRVFCHAGDTQRLVSTAVLTMAVCENDASTYG